MWVILLSVGLYRGTLSSPAPLRPGCAVVFRMDDHAGRTGLPMDVVTCLQALLDQETPSPQFIADSLLEHALHLDQNRPADDISVVVLAIQKHVGDEVRRMTVRLPLMS
jgi:hypothetical protein